MQTHVRVGVGVVVYRDGKVLLGKRKNSHGEGCWAFPGGHLEMMESIEACATREVQEETGLTLSHVHCGPYSNDRFAASHVHYLTVFAIAESAQGEPVLMEPDKCEGWQWFDWNALPEPLFRSTASLIQMGFDPTAFLAQARKP